jgi:hypothetical protein
MSAVPSRKPEPATFTDPVSGLHRRIPPAVAPVEKHVAPRLWVSIAAVILVVTLSIGGFGLAAGYYELAASAAAPAAICALLLALADNLGAPC